MLKLCCVRIHTAQFLPVQIIQFHISLLHIPHIPHESCVFRSDDEIPDEVGVVGHFRRQFLTHRVEVVNSHQHFPKRLDLGWEIGSHLRKSLLFTDLNVCGLLLSINDTLFEFQPLLYVCIFILIRINR